MTSKKELELVFEQLEKEHRFSGAMLVSQDGEVVFEKAYGFASRQLNVPNVLDNKISYRLCDKDVYRNGCAYSL